MVGALKSLALALEADGADGDEIATMLGAADAFAEQSGCQWTGPVFEPAIDDLRSRVDPAAHARGMEVPLRTAVEQTLEEAGTRPPEMRS